MIGNKNNISLAVFALVILFGSNLFISSCDWLGLNRLNSGVYSDTLRVSIHSDMLDPEVLNEFQNDQDVLLDIYYHDSNEEEFFPPDIDFDLVMVDQFIVEEHSEYFHTIDQDNIKNRRYLDFRFTRLPQDFGLIYSFPVFWGSFGFAYNENQYSGLPLSWSHLFQPNSIHRGYISVLNDERYLLGTALLYLGFSPNTTDSSEVLAAAQLIEEAKYYYRSFSDTNEMIEQFKNGEITAFPIWSGTATSLKRTHPHTRFILPAEGVLFFVTSFVIMKDSEKHELAEKFIDYNIEPTRMARHTNYGGYANTIPSSNRYIDRLIVMGPSYINPFVAHASNELDALSPETLEMYKRVWDSLNTNEFEGYEPPHIYEFR